MESPFQCPFGTATRKGLIFEKYMPWEVGECRVMIIYPGSGTKHAGIPALPLIQRVTLGKLFNLPWPQFLTCKIETIKIENLESYCGIILVKPLVSPWHMVKDVMCVILYQWRWMTTGSKGEQEI